MSSPFSALRSRLLATAAALAAFAPVAPAQDLDHDYGLWTAFAGQGPLEAGEEARWRWWFDVHARFANDSDGFDQSIVRPGVGYELSPRSTLWGGYAWVHTDPAGAASFDEHRLWQQYLWGRPYGSNNFLSRTRLEQRFVETGDDVGWRLRQFLRLTRPLPRSSQLGLRFWDELFFDLNDTDWGADTGFAQNRLFAGLGWTFERAEHLTLEFGYLNQYVDRSGGADSMNHILSVQLLLTR